jgi:hypothetical protein
MDQPDTHVRIFSGKVRCEMLGAIDRTMLASRAAE